MILEIENLSQVIDMMKEAKKVGLMKDISLEKVEQILKDKEFPVRVQVSMDQIFDLAQNPMVRKLFGKKIEDAVINAIVKVANE